MMCVTPELKGEVLTIQRIISIACPPVPKTSCGLEVWNLSRDSSGMSFDFTTDAEAIYVRYALVKDTLAMSHMAASGVSGLDLYAACRSLALGGDRAATRTESRGNGDPAHAQSSSAAFAFICRSTTA